MKSKIFIIVAFLWVNVSLIAQERETHENIKYSNISEFGLVTASIKGVSIEATTAHGFSFNKAHHLGLGVGIGVNIYTVTTVSSWDGSYSYKSPKSLAYMPIFLNYRFYLKPEKTFSPHVNIAIGGLALEESAGFYSSITMGFRAGKFSFSSGLSLLPMHRKEEVINYREVTDMWGYTYTETYSEYQWKMAYPFGITLKCGFSF